MFKTFGRSWELTKLSFSVLMKDKELFAYPILSFFFSLIMLIIFIIPLAFTDLANSIGFDSFGMIGVFAFYFVMALIATFFNFCVVYTAKIRFEGGNAKFAGTIKYAFSKFLRIFQWSLVTSIVKVIIYSLRRNNKGITGLIMSAIAKIFELGWKISTVFAIPVIVYNNAGPFSAVKQSVLALKKTWGEQIIRYVGVNVVSNALTWIGILLGIGGTFLDFLIGGFNVANLIILWSLVIIYLTLVGITFSLVSSVFNTALFVYAQTGKVPNGFTKEHLQNAVEAKN